MKLMNLGGETSFIEVEITIEKLKSPGISFFPSVLLQAGDRTQHKFIVWIWNREELPHSCKESVIVPVYKVGDKIAL
jgi:hypothetical protein